MTRRVEIVPLESGYCVKAWAQTEAEAFALQSALVSAPPAKSFTPGLCAGEPFDAPEEPWPSDATARVYPPNCDGGGYAEPTPGEILAHASFEAATDGDECDGTVCLMTRGAGD
jgi:hypothetical protein